VSRSGDALAALAWFAIAGAVLVGIDQLSQIVVSLGSLEPAAAAWRYRAAVLVSGRGAAFVLASLFLGAGLLARARGGLRAWAALQAALALLLLGAAAVVALEGRAVSGDDAPGAAGALDPQRLRALIVALTAVSVFLALALLGRRVAVLHAAPPASDRPVLGTQAQS
jgi:hypothetical protein